MAAVVVVVAADHNDDGVNTVVAVAAVIEAVAAAVDFDQTNHRTRRGCSYPAVAVVRSDVYLLMAVVAVEMKMLAVAFDEGRVMVVEHALEMVVAVDAPIQPNVLLLPLGLDWSRSHCPCCLDDQLLTNQQNAFHTVVVAAGGAPRPPAAAADCAPFSVAACWRRRHLHGGRVVTTRGTKIKRHALRLDEGCKVSSTGEANSTTNWHFYPTAH